MTTILDLPEEILYEIFNYGFDQWDLLNCQKVCRAWYKPAHITLLNEFEIINVRSLQPFINSFDHNPDPAYLKAVKSIIFTRYSTDDPFPQIDDLYQKLFYRFPNLKKVELDPAFLVNFNDEICKTFLVNCPKLESFTANNELFPEPEYGDLIYKARLLITEIDLNKFEDQPQYGDITQFLSSFPRLQRIFGRRNTIITNFKQLLAILLHTPLLQWVHMGSEIDNGNAAQIYLSSAPKDDREKLIDRLSKIVSLNLFYTADFCVNSFKFVEKYLTGLKYLYIYSFDNQSWTEAHARGFCSLVKKVSTIYSYDSYFNRMNIDALSKCFPTTMQEIFPLTTDHKKSRHLTLLIDNTNTLSISPTFIELGIRLVVDDQHTLPEISQRLFTPAYNNVDKFTFLTCSYQAINLYDYNIILCRMPSLKQIVIDVPKEFVDAGNGNDCKLELPLVEDLTILTHQETEYQSLLDSYCVALPNLKRLTFFYCPGNWIEDWGVYEVKLPKYSLETLYLDVTQVQRQSSYISKPNKNFFILDIKISSSSEHREYKISLDLSSASRLDESDREELQMCGFDYLEVSVTIENLQNLKLFMHVHSGSFCCNGRLNSYYPISPFFPPPHVMILHDNQWK